jgi:hypothetical protein
LTGRFDLRVTVGVDGEVQRARLLGDSLPDEFVHCVVSEARRFTFPPPTGGPLTFDVPLRFATRRP